MCFAAVVPALAGQMGRFHGRKTDTYPHPQPPFHIQVRKQKSYSASTEAIPRLWTQKAFG